MQASGTTASTTQKYFVMADNQLVAVLSTNTGSTTPTPTYMHVDYQGSVTATSNEAGERVDKYTFDAFGARSQSTSGTGLTAIMNDMTRGYTGHEMDDENGFINMNARIYDPRLGRFLTPDTIIPDVENPQALNRYSYVLNNPGKYIDPTGHIPSRNDGSTSPEISEYDFKEFDALFGGDYYYMSLDLSSASLGGGVGEESSSMTGSRFVDTDSFRMAMQGNFYFGIGGKGKKAISAETSLGYDNEKGLQSSGGFSAFSATYSADLVNKKHNVSVPMKNGSSIAINGIDCPDFSSNCGNDSILRQTAVIDRSVFKYNTAVPLGTDPLALSIPDKEHHFRLQIPTLIYLGVEFKIKEKELNGVGRSIIEWLK